MSHITRSDHLALASGKARVVSLEFDGPRVRQETTPSTGAPVRLDQQLDVHPFEWNMFGLVVSALPLRAGYRATMYARE